MTKTDEMMKLGKLGKLGTLASDCDGKQES